MSAMETFQWLIEDVFKHPDEPARKMIEERRDYFFTLRSEDERQRFVDELVQEFKTKPGMSPTRK